MSPNSKDRLINSVAGGIAIPIAYGGLLFILGNLFRGHELSAVRWLVAPLAWPVYLLYLLPASIYEWDLFRNIDTGVVFFILYFFGANFALYSLLTYAGIRWRQRMPRLR